MINKVTRQKASHQVLAQLKEGISNGTFPVGEKLPSENLLAEAFGVSRVPVREALGILEVSGIISSRQGGGHRVEQHSLLSKYQPLVLEIADPDEVEALLEMREVIEQQAACMAAERHTEQELRAIELALNDFKRCTLDEGLIGHREDYLFHRAIMQASHNPFFVQILDNMHELYLGVLVYSLSKNLGRQDERQRVIDEHQRVFMAIKARDPAAATAAMQSHLSNVRGKLRRLDHEELG
ncbi:FadR/GntR family transcriptional regulator [Serratia liquefaciens]|jgi:GntR family transcriptional repressor for pyruvate dehydrogenase complex|uniref:FadR family transcriptional regulator n=1 Tax=Serratia liquefaciens TaxID=614 RepID=A0A515CWQ1_SERLI|nr:FadR/GntR family transcriptional regulator [Serratia liquefaciens]AKE10912.1 GntR family transcriptional regulator [Serratia liquefaciens]MBF8104690.1 FadR family transcriptional regulator [Serratia liquefaciens]MBI6161250.1 FadR family transcriptional regulator [Serratia liquefaciens]QDL32591.1 FadR family transcriptional regulator [Serratia liquefaciens]RYM72000.1 GntR family transcriptional regulator [Serratia liquefaciens]